jgi:Ca2+-binding RTX toxin-like protein
MRSLLLVPLVLALLAAPAAAGAATIELTDSEADQTSSFRVLGDEGPDDLRIVNTVSAGLDVFDPSRPVSGPTTRCTTLNEHYVHCQGIGAGIVDVDAGGGNDRVTVVGSLGLHTLLGGAGSDYLQGGSGDDVIDGGAGNDTITSSEGRDMEYGGEGNDAFVVRQDRLGDGQLLDGGPGGDALDLEATPHGILEQPVDEPLVVDLAAGRITSPRGTTTLLGFHGARVSARNVVVLGDDGGNDVWIGAGGRADGRGGDDHLIAYDRAATLIGGEGDDVLEAGMEGGRFYHPALGSTLDGGPGNDHLHAPKAASVACGPGSDVVSLDRLRRPVDCEGSPTWFGFLGPVAVAGQALRASVNGFYAGCGLSVQGFGNGRPVTTPVRTRRNGPMSLRLPLSGKAVRPPAVVRLRVRIANACPLGRKPWRYVADTADQPAPVVTLTGV